MAPYQHNGQRNPPAMPDGNALTQVATLQHPALWAAIAGCCGIAFDRYFHLWIVLYGIIIFISVTFFLFWQRNQVSPAKR
ncbi:hypothetical protein OAG71_02300 [bacterium]|nr:hypothetical protein [bacterium]